jgi:hypothetical protein
LLGYHLLVLVLLELDLLLDLTLEGLIDGLPQLLGYLVHVRKLIERVILVLHPGWSCWNLPLLLGVVEVQDQVELLLEDLDLLLHCLCLLLLGEVLDDLDDGVDVVSDWLSLVSFEILHVLLGEVVQEITHRVVHLVQDL